MSEPAHVVVGVERGQTDAVLLCAAEYAKRFDADLICAYVDSNRYVVEEHPDGTIRSMPIDPDLIDDGGDKEAIDPRLQAHLADVLGAIEFIHKQIVATRDSGIPVLVVSTELDEVVALADRIMVLYRGRVVGIVPADTPRQTLGLMMTGERPKDLKDVVA